jgi:hypothetical protein
LKRSKKLFLVLAGIFFLTMIILGYDISRRTTFPGSKKLLLESLAPSDTVNVDSAKVIKTDN